MSTNIKVALPSIHLNGTSKESLLEDVCKAADKLREALDVMGPAGPNARDYYVQAPGAFQVAQDQHESRCNRIGDIIRELEELASGIADGGFKRETPAQWGSKG